ncbi:hypothetical protein MY494_11975 [Synechococcus sp. A10-1-5-1]|uniref:hypothetical protein n=1 Tax=Synechococcus sp. A10-1-5-1 TaxID=2936507 RepID=UPI0020015DAF|nr:hypothetical protein [Synechococcus sp. A10-1-5-1]UPM50013.1 hypothetical protein MY494_11975 [Synechococcus sp. A10-1-5-1]
MRSAGDLLRTAAVLSFWALLIVTAILSSQLRLQRSRNTIDFCDEDSLGKVCAFHAVLKD